MKPFRPMLAAAVEDIEALVYPLIATPKIDGIRCVLRGGVLARSGKLIPNVYVRESLKDAPENLDGELITGNFQATSSGIMTRTGEPDFKFWIFDIVADLPYIERLQIIKDVKHPRIEFVPWEYVNSSDELRAYEEAVLKEGFEGVCLRKPNSPYKQGRSTLKEGYLLKLKRFQDAEAVIVGFEEQYRNDNVLQTNELGYAKRSHNAEGMVPKDTLGKLIVEKDGVTFGIGTGFTDAQRKEIWDNRESYLGKIVKFKSQPYGVKDAPRLPVFLGFRSEVDL